MPQTSTLAYLRDIAVKWGSGIEDSAASHSPTLYVFRIARRKRLGDASVRNRMDATRILLERGISPLKTPEGFASGFAGQLDLDSALHAKLG